MARRRIAISLIGFTGLATWNIAGRGTIPFNPFDVTNPWVVLSLVLLVGGLAIRSWAAGTLNKSREVTSVGPYALSRNPLYIGSFMMMFAFCILCKDVPTLLFVAGPMALLYRIQVLFEEKRLVQMFPGAWDDYVAATPRFFPAKFSRKAIAGWTPFEWMRNREYRALGASCIGIILIFAWQWYRTSS